MGNRTIRLLAVSIAYIVMLAHGLLPHHHHSIAFALEVHEAHLHHATEDTHHHQHDGAWEIPHFANEVHHSHGADDSGHEHSIESLSPNYIAPKVQDVDGGSLAVTPFVALLFEPIALPLVEVVLPPIAAWASSPPWIGRRPNACGLRAPPSHSA